MQCVWRDKGCNSITGLQIQPVPASCDSLRTVMNLKQNFMKQFISDLLSITCIHLVDSDQHGVELKCKYFHPSNWSTNKFARRQTVYAYNMFCFVLCTPTLVFFTKTSNSKCEWVGFHDQGNCEWCGVRWGELNDVETRGKTRHKNVQVVYDDIIKCHEEKSFQLQWYWYNVLITSQISTIIFPSQCLRMTHCQHELPWEVFQVFLHLMTQ